MLEQGRRLSESILWEYMRRYYEARGPEAWRSGEVPTSATSSAYMARAYADVIEAYVRDLRAGGAIDAAQPVYVVELAAGSGELAFRIAGELRERARATALRGLDVRYVMTDFAAANVAAWQAHPQLRPLVEAGALAFGTFDVPRDDAILLAGAGALASTGTLAAGTVANPLVVLGNYAFDTFPHDLVHVAAGSLHHVRVTTAAHGERGADPRALLSNLRIRYEIDPDELDPDAYAGDEPHVAAILAHYRARLAGVTIGVPIAGLVALRKLAALSGGRMLLLASDKGFASEDELDHPDQLSMQFHGSFSMAVNFDALGRAVTARGGHYLATSRRDLELKTIACILGGGGGGGEHTTAAFADTRATFQARVDDFGPGELGELLRGARPTTLPHLLGLLRLSGWDPRLAWDSLDLLRAHTAGADLPAPARRELRLALERVAARYFPGAYDLPAALAPILDALREPT